MFCLCCCIMISAASKISQRPEVLKQAHLEDSRNMKLYASY